MIDQQMDIYAVYKDFKTKEYKRFNDGKLVAHKLGTIYPAGGQYGYPTAPNISLDLEPKKSADIIILPKGVKPGEEMQQGMGQPQNNYQNQRGHISQSMPNNQQGDPGPSGRDY
jgi:hypothetical protein